jgi:hypothetical protein
MNCLALIRINVLNSRDFRIYVYNKIKITQSQTFSQQLHFADGLKVRRLCAAISHQLDKKR